LESEADQRKTKKIDLTTSQPINGLIISWLGRIVSEAGHALGYPDEIKSALAG